MLLLVVAWWAVLGLLTVSHPGLHYLLITLNLNLSMKLRS
ncbi:unnamed protein product [Acanthoscelides obtectus]|uniref:Uncharacterized protein n=1 Tax=Acanthoscelides obtectus TaxID=200917 RepID=A0A9P0LIQ1_ACAOB|nr:unnamed protein product [Acanthoscelides obtectus]CAK1625762.1 hypothetical protein AOBTE_LOCUS3383 [Acanthoscelides obtectus]